MNKFTCEAFYNSYSRDFQGGNNENWDSTFGYDEAREKDSLSMSVGGLAFTWKPKRGTSMRIGLGSVMDGEFKTDVTYKDETGVTSIENTRWDLKKGFYGELTMVSDLWRSKKVFIQSQAQASYATIKGDTGEWIGSLFPRDEFGFHYTYNLDANYTEVSARLLAGRELALNQSSIVPYAGAEISYGAVNGSAKFGIEGPGNFYFNEIPILALPKSSIGAAVGCNMMMGRIVATVDASLSTQTTYRVRIGTDF